MENYNVFQDPEQKLFKEEVARGTRLLNITGLSPSGESGDISVRDLKSGLIYISGSPVWCFQKNLRDARGWERFVTDLDETIMIPWSDPTIEWYTHVAVYRRRPDVQAVVHTHGLWASVFAAMEMDVPLKYAGEGMDGVIRCAKYVACGTREVGAVTAEALGDDNCVLMGNHGAVFVGKDLNEAFDRALWCEDVCHKAYMALLHEKLLG